MGCGVMNDDDIRLEGLTIYLAKEGLEKPSDAFKDVRSLRTFDVSDDQCKRR